MGIKFCQFTCLKNWQIDQNFRFPIDLGFYCLGEILCNSIIKKMRFKLFGPIISPINNKHLLSEVKLQKLVRKVVF